MFLNAVLRLYIGIPFYRRKILYILVLVGLIVEIVYVSRIPPRPSGAGERLLVDWPKTDPRLYWVGDNNCAIIDSCNNGLITNSSNNRDNRLRLSSIICNGSSEDDTSVRNSSIKYSNDNSSNTNSRSSLNACNCRSDISTKNNNNIGINNNSSTRDDYNRNISRNSNNTRSSNSSIGSTSNRRRVIVYLYC